MKLAKAAAVMTVILACTGCATVKKDTGSVKGTYSMHVGGYDWGCGTDSIILSLTNPVDAVTKDTFTVIETKKAYDMTQKTFPLTVQDFTRTVIQAYLSDASGTKVSEPSKYVTLYLQCTPEEGSPFLYQFDTGRNVWNEVYELTVSRKAGAALTSGGVPVTSFVIDKKYTEKSTDADVFAFHTYTTSNGQKYKYADYKPAEKTDKLVIWLHGAGEGGVPEGAGISDMAVTLLGNKVVPLAGKQFQSMLGGAVVLVPQCPTMWMDDGSGKYTKDGTSTYTESLEEFIEWYIKKSGSKKVLLTGCSNGGFMTMNLIMHYPDVYTAAVPVCEAYNNAWITDTMLGNIKDKPLFFIYSKDDTVVPPADNEIPVIARLQAMKSSDLHSYVSEHVTDLSGVYKGKDGNAYQYMGHWSWIYFFNNQAVSDGSTITVWDWMAAQAH